MPLFARRIAASLTALLIFVFLVTTVRADEPDSAPNTQERNWRKSISYIDAVLTVGEASQPQFGAGGGFWGSLFHAGLHERGASLSRSQERMLLAAIRAEIDMPRFDYNPLPEPLLSDFHKQLARENIHDPEELAGLIEKMLLPEIARVLDYEKEMRALGLVSEAERHSFIVEKAKESGVTGQDLETILNSAYVYVPMISRVTFQMDSARHRVNYQLEGSLLWYAVDLDSAASGLRLLRKLSAEGESHRGNPASLFFTPKGQYFASDEAAFENAAQSLAANLAIATREMREFQLLCPLTAAGSGWIEFPLGRREGLDIDDKYKIIEYQQQPDGRIAKKSVGMVRVSKVADNRNQAASSVARAFLGGSFQPGMLVEEHPRANSDLSLRLALLPLRVTGGFAGAGGDTSLTFERQITRFPVGQFYLQENIAALTHSSQTFFCGYVEGGLARLSHSQAFGDDFPTGFYWGAGLGLAKKYYFNRFHFGLEAYGSYADLSFAGTIPDGFVSEHEKWKWRLRTIGLTFGANLEVALGYDLNIGAGAAFRAFSPFTFASYEVAGKSISLENSSDLYFYGWGLQLYFTYSLPRW